MSQAPSTQPHPRVGGYELLARIGEGGMGVVHLARAADGRRVALKVLRPHIVGDSEARERLAREVGSLRRVRSHRVAEIVDADPYAETPYVATRYVPGLSLYDHVREEGTLTGEDLRYLAHGLAEALVAVHAVGVLHRDVKPSNVLMEGRAPVLIDFGLARLAEDPRLTHTGWLLGTPGYLAPEILYGEDATPAADVHAWAATIVFAATGRPPYGTGPVMAILDRVRLGEYDLDGVPEGLRDLLAAALSPEPGDRPSLTEARDWLAPRGPRSAPGPELLTQPVRTSHRAPVTAPPPPVPSAMDEPATVVTPIVGALPDPGTLAPDPGTRLLPASPSTPATPAPVEDHRNARRGVRLQVVVVGAFLTALLAAAPYVGALVMALGILLTRTVSVTRERHWRRRMIRGHPRWFDGPMTTMSLPWYLVLASAGGLLLWFWGVAVALAVGVVVTVLGGTTAVGLVLAGAGFALGCWWGPGSSRVREVTHATLRRTARRSAGGGLAQWLVVGVFTLAAVVLLGSLLTRGPIWAPGSHAPWTSGALSVLTRGF